MGKKLYSLFERPSNAAKGARWKRISHLALTKTTAVRVFQDALLEPTMYPISCPGMVRELRTVADTTIQVTE